MQPMQSITAYKSSETVVPETLQKWLGAGPSLYRIWFWGTLVIAIGMSLSKGGGGIAPLLVWLAFVAAIGHLYKKPFLIFYAAIFRTTQRTEKKYAAVYRERLSRFGEVKYLDFEPGPYGLTGLALAGGHLFHLVGREIRQVNVDALINYSWKIESNTMIGGNGFQKLDLLERDLARSGFSIQTLDPDHPQIWHNTSDEAVCRRWAAVMDNIFRER